MSRSNQRNIRASRACETAAPLSTQSVGSCLSAVCRLSLSAQSVGCAAAERCNANADLLVQCAGVELCPQKPAQHLRPRRLPVLARGVAQGRLSHRADRQVAPLHRRRPRPRLGPLRRVVPLRPEGRGRLLPQPRTQLRRRPAHRRGRLLHRQLHPLRARFHPPPTRQTVAALALLRRRPRPYLPARRHQSRYIANEPVPTPADIFPPRHPHPPARRPRRRSNTASPTAEVKPPGSASILSAGFFAVDDGGWVESARLLLRAPCCTTVDDLTPAGSSNRKLYSSAASINSSHKCRMSVWAS